MLWQLWTLILYRTADGCVVVCVCLFPLQVATVIIQGYAHGFSDALAAPVRASTAEDSGNCSLYSCGLPLSCGVIALSSASRLSVVASIGSTCTAARWGYVASLCASGFEI